MDIRANARDCYRLERAWRNSPLNKEAFSLTPDENTSTPVIVAHQDDGTFTTFLRGFQPVREFIRYGYNRIRRNCPYRHRRCIGERCALYHIDNLTGDCSQIWRLFKE